MIMVSVGKKGSGFWQVGRVQKKVSEMGFSPLRTSNSTYNTFTISTIQYDLPRFLDILRPGNTKMGNDATISDPMK